MRMYAKLEKPARFPVTRFLLKLSLNRRDYVLLTGPKKSQTGREDVTVIAQNTCHP